LTVLRWIFATLLTISLAGTAVAADSSPLDAVVQIDAQVPGQARTANVLGKERRGSGVFIDSSGLVVTIGYLILEADAVSVTLNDGTRMPASVVAYDHDSGFGLLRTLQPPKVVPMRIGDSTTASESANMLVVGYDGTPQAIAVRVMSRRPFAGYWEYLLEDAIFTVPPFSGFGGAALVDSDGRLVGIGSLFVGDAMGKDTQSPGNMFVPINELKPILADLLDAGRRSGQGRPWLGITSAELEGHLLVRRTSGDGPAARAGVESGDIIVSVAGAPVADMADFYRKVWAVGPAGSKIPLDVLHPGRGMETIEIRSMDRYDWLRINPGN